MFFLYGIRIAEWSEKRENYNDEEKLFEKFSFPLGKKLDFVNLRSHEIKEKLNRKNYWIAIYWNEGSNPRNLKSFAKFYFF